MTSDVDLDALRTELEDFAQPEAKGGRPPREERIIAGFQEIQRFVDQHGRRPQHGEDRDIFERLYAVRLDRLRSLEECRSVLTPLDHQGLLPGAPAGARVSEEAMGHDELRAELQGAGDRADITVLKHVRSREEIRAAEDIARRETCKDFESFKPLFERAENDLKAGHRQTRPFGKDASVATGNFFILGGQMVYVAAMGDSFRTPNGETDARLRVIYSNATESDLLLRSLQRALYKDEAGRRLTDPDPGPLFADKADSDDLASGTIYVLRSKSELPLVAANRTVLHKIGVTGGNVEGRIANARLDPTFLMADVEIVATYELFNINRIRLENLIHRVFDPARLDIVIQDRFGNPVVPREWFLVPIFVVNEVVERIKNGTVTEYVYDPKVARLVQASDARS